MLGQINLVLKIMRQKYFFMLTIRKTLETLSMAPFIGDHCSTLWGKKQETQVVQQGFGVTSCSQGTKSHEVHRPWWLFTTTESRTMSECRGFWEQ